MLPVAVDAMGGDRAPAEILLGAKRAHQELAIPVLLVGDPEVLGHIDALEVLAATETISMHEDPGTAVRRKKDSSLVRAAEAVRDKRASAMVSAGNTGATMASALLRMGRIKGVARPAIATPLPVPGSTPTVLIDAGANAECQADWMVQFAQMGSAYATERYGIAKPRVGLLSIGEEATKGTALVKDAHAALAAGAGVNFIGNVEGRDLLSEGVDVVVTDGFTGNVALKTLEGGLGFFLSTLTAAIQTNDETRKAGSVLLEALAPAAEELDPDSTGGAMLLGADGGCIISHGSSSARAIVKAVQVARDMVDHGLVERLKRAVRA